MKYFFWNKYLILTHSFSTLFYFHANFKLFQLRFYNSHPNMIVKKDTYLNVVKVGDMFYTCTFYRLWCMVLAFVVRNIISLKLYHVEKCSK